MSSFTNPSILNAEIDDHESPEIERRVVMTSNEQSNDTLDKLSICDLCEQKINPTVRIYNNDIRLCSKCFDHIEKIPEAVAKSIERFLLGNVV